MTGSSGLIVVRTFSHVHEAHLACSALQAAGIDARLADQYIVAANWLYSNAIGGVKLLVPAGDAAAAGAVLNLTAEPEAVAADGDAANRVSQEFSCPQCGSHDVQPVTLGRRLLFLTWLLAGVPLFPVIRRLQCVRCGCRFRA